MPASGADRRPRALPGCRIPIRPRSRRGRTASACLACSSKDFCLDATFEQQNPCPGADAPHPDHLVGDVGQGEVIEQEPAVRLERVVIGGSEQGRIRPRTASRSTSIMSSSRTISGGSLMIRRLPSTVVSFPIACRLSRVCAFASAALRRLEVGLSFFNWRTLRLDLYSAMAFRC